jgi:hypothetical protein
MSTSPIGMGEQNQAEREKFENELKRVVNASDKGRAAAASDRFPAFQMHCPSRGTCRLPWAGPTPTSILRAIKSRQRRSKF